MNYEIFLTPREDASVDIEYHIEWEVLESDEAGPLTWVRIGLPNVYIEELKGLSDNIDTVEYTRKSQEKFYADVTFDREYEEGEVVDFRFSANVNYLYYAENPQRYPLVYTYTFTPGWFDKIEVERLYIQWNTYGKNPNTATPMCEQYDDYYAWEDKLSMGERYSIHVTFDDGVFNFEPGEHSNTTKENVAFGCIGVLVIVGALVLIVYNIKRVDIVMAADLVIVDQEGAVVVYIEVLVV